MKTPIKPLLVILVALACAQPLLRAQFVTTSSTSPYTSPYDFEYRSDGTLLATGHYGTGSLSNLGAGTRLLFFPDLAAFRAGSVNSTQWDSANLGSYSVAFGGNTIASASYSFAAGYINKSTGTGSTTFGSNNTAAGMYSTALGYTSMANGAYTLASGNNTVATGYNSTVLGANLTAASCEELATGQYALGLNSSGGASSATGWNGVDPLFEVGNGTSTTASNALTVYKNGNATVSGVLTATGGVMTTAAAIGTTDIPMFGH